MRLNKHIIRLIFMGIIASFFFSSTFVLNRWMSINNGHWYWTASLRYVYVFLLLSIIIFLKYSGTYLKKCIRCFLQYPKFWIFTGGIGFAGFYLFLCFAASFAPGWIIATTWQLTIVISPFVLFILGKNFSYKGFIFAILIFCGVLLVNISQFNKFSTYSIIAIISVLIAAFFYPFGNTLCGLAKNGGHKYVIHIKDPVMNNSFCRVWLMTAGALPILFVAGIFINPPPPTQNQLFTVLFVALSTGIIATSIFLHARHKAESSFAIAAVDSTQAGEVPFSLLIEWNLFKGHPPNGFEFLGIILVLIGITFFAFSQALTKKI